MKATYNVDEVAALLGLGRNTVYAAVKRREIPAIRIGRRLVIPRLALDNLLQCKFNGIEPGPEAKKEV
jgi:excisionase family DNA binding protein